MWVMRWTIIGIIMLAILGFAMQNPEMVRLSIWTWHSEPMPLYLVAYFAFGVGILVAALVAAFNQVQHRLSLTRARREISRLKEELTQLRRLTLDDALLEEDIESELDPISQNSVDKSTDIR